ncbi:MAG: PHP domain-containing protein [Gemmatimonadota bacterium]
MRRLLLPALLTGTLVFARLTVLPELSDPTGAPLPSGLHLAIPPLYFAAAPLFTLWDGVSMLSLTRLKGFLAGFAALYVVWRVIAVTLALRGPNLGARHAVPLRVMGREVVLLIAALVAFVAFVFVGAVWHRPMLALAGVPTDAAVVDFHSHTNASHDVTGLVEGFDLAANLRWHARAGFDAVFITDHNTTDGWRSEAPGGSIGPSACPGTEVSAKDAHIVLLGDSAEVDRRLYDRDLNGVLTLLREAGPRYNALSVASLPEYERNHWQHLGQFIAAGLDGFEVVNASPKANEISRARRDSVIAMARAANRFIVGVSDQHGWGATSMTWTLVTVPGWRARPAAICADVLTALRTGGFGSTRIVERPRVRSDDPWPGWLTPVAVLWQTWRGMPASLTWSWVGWIWLPVALGSLRATRRGQRVTGG